MRLIRPLSVIRLAALLLGGALRRAEPYEVSQWGVPHFALRAPAYPLFLAACQVAFGNRALPARLVQAALGAACVLIVFRLTVRATGEAARGVVGHHGIVLTDAPPSSGCLQSL